MTIKDLKTGDIIIQRAGHIGLFIEKGGEGYIIYQSSGFDVVDENYNEDLTDFVSGPDFDVMQIYREEHGAISFSDYMEAELIFNREESWEKP